MNAPSNRRGFLKALAAAPIAAPIVMKTTAERMMVGSPPSLIGAYGMGGTAIAGSNTDWVKEELANVLGRKKKIHSGKARKGNVNEPGIYARVDALRSVSPTHRIRMAREEISTKYEANELSYLDEQIENLKEKLGLFGDILS